MRCSTDLMICGASAPPRAGLKIPRRIHCLVQDARNDELGAVHPIIDAMLAYCDRAHARSQVAGHAQRGIVEQPRDRGIDIPQIRFGDNGTVRGDAIIEDAVNIADGGGALGGPQLRRWRASPRAMMSSIDVSTSGEASPTSIAACNAFTFSAYSWSRRTRSRT